MKRHRTILHLSALLAGSCALTPATATAGGPLLSGYGGPGAGAQTIIGATLLNGPGNGSGGGTGGSGGGSRSTGAAVTNAGSPPGRGTQTGGGGTARLERRPGKASGRLSGAHSTSPHIGVSPAGTAGMDTSWFSGRDLAMIALAAAALGLTAAATVGLAGSHDEIGGKPR